MPNSPEEAPVPRNRRLTWGEEPMTKAARSIFLFAVYLLGLGIWLLLAPNSMLRLFGMPEAQDVWIRVVGMLVVILSFYYASAARAELAAFFQWTVYARASVILFFAAFVLLGLARPILLLFGLVDLAAAGWTQVALNSDREAQVDA
jgi:hypothetical protein